MQHFPATLDHLSTCRRDDLVRRRRSRNAIRAKDVAAVMSVFAPHVSSFDGEARLDLQP
jgi:hypothetical protein